MRDGRTRRGSWTSGVAVSLPRRRRISLPFAVKGRMRMGYVDELMHAQYEVCQ